MKKKIHNGLGNGLGKILIYLRGNIRKHACFMMATFSFTSSLKCSLGSSVSTLLDSLHAAPCLSLHTYISLLHSHTSLFIITSIFTWLRTFKYISLLHLFSLQLPLPCLHMVTNLHTFFILPTHSPHSYIPLHVSLHLPFSTHTPLIRLCSFPSSSLQCSTQLPILCGLSPPIAKL